MRTQLTILVVLLSFVTAAVGAEEKNKFLVRINGAPYGSEEYTITRTASGYKLKSKASAKEPGRVTMKEQEQTLEPDFTLKRYSLMTAMIEGIQAVEANREKDKLRMSVRMPQREPRVFSVPIAPRIIVLDNMVVSHFQVLLDSFQGKPPAPDWGFLVPQQLSLVPGGVTQMPRVQDATLAGQAISVRKYSVNAGGLIMECWADATDNRLMRVWVPTQKVEFIREGFALGGAAPATPAGH